MNALAADTRSVLDRAIAREVFGSFVDETIAILARAPARTISFAVGSPPPEALALARPAELVAEVLERDGAAALGYGITEGDPELREIVAAAATATGVHASADDVVITAGAIQAIDIACRLYLAPGDLVVTESPGFANALAMFRNHGARVLEVPVDADGLDVPAAARLLRERNLRPRAFFVVPSFQNPSGATLSRRRREALIALAEAYDALVIEDDPYREIRFRGEAPPPLAALARERVISVGSFSKVFLPGLRVGWAISDPSSVRRMAAVKQTMDSSTSSLGQRMVVAFHRRGGVEAHVAALRSLYREKQVRARATLASAFGDELSVRWGHPEGGFYLWVDLGGRVAARRLLDLALEEGVAFVPGDAFTTGEGFRSALRLSYSYPPPERIDEGVRRLRRAYARARSD